MYWKRLQSQIKNGYLCKIFGWSKVICLNIKGKNVFSFESIDSIDSLFLSKSTVIKVGCLILFINDKKVKI